MFASKVFEVFEVSKIPFQSSLVLVKSKKERLVNDQWIRLTLGAFLTLSLKFENKITYGVKRMTNSPIVG